MDNHMNLIESFLPNVLIQYNLSKCKRITAYDTHLNFSEN